MKEIIKEIRRQLIMTQAEFAEAIGISEYTIRNWEQGKTQYMHPKQKRKVKEFCDKYNIEIDISKL